MLSDNLQVVLVRTRFPENVGMAARACANMGCRRLCLADPELWIREKAEPLATPKGIPVLDNLQVYDNLESAIADSNFVFGTTARTGGWRKSVIPPWQAADEIRSRLGLGEKISLVFGPEDKGLDNGDILFCGRLIHIKTACTASSLNLAQCVLLVLYECARAGMEIKPGKSAGTINCAELERLKAAFKEALRILDCNQGQSADYYFIQWQNILARANLRRHEYDALMGFCRQIKNRIQDK